MLGEWGVGEYGIEFFPELELIFENISLDDFIPIEGCPIRFDVYIDMTAWPCSATEIKNTALEF